MSLLSLLLKTTSNPARPANRPADSKVEFQKASDLFRSNDFRGAKAALSRVIQLDPMCSQAHYLLSAIALQDQDIDCAIRLLQQSIELEPTNADFHFGLGSIYAAEEKLTEAIGAFHEAIRLRPDSRDWRLELAATLIKAGRLSEAMDAYEAREKSGPPDARAYFDLGEALLKRRRLNEAEQALRQAATMAPDSGGIQFYLAVVHREQHRPLDAEASARKAIDVAPDMPQGWFALAGALMRQAKSAEAVGHYRQAISLMPDYEAAWDGLLFAMNYADRWSAREIYDTHVEWGQRFPSVERLLIPPSHHRASHRIRIGYLSADYRQHPVAHFIEPVLRHHDQRFEVLCYHTDEREDIVTKRLKRCVRNWRSVGTASDDELVKLLRADDLDILVELSGHSEGHRLGVLARRVAPIQVTYLGYPNTTGLSAIDYRITDGRADPPGEADELHVEKLVRLPGFLCYSPPSAARPQARTSRRSRYVTFGSFNNFAKISPKCLELWAKVLSSIPHSRLLIKTFGLQDPGLQLALLEQLEHAGAERDRIAIQLPVRDHQDHMQVYGEVDIALDTFPYNGTTTTLDALWMGVPVITLVGDRHASRVGLSILSNIGLGELVAHTPDQYVAIAAAMAANTEKLEDLRHSLRERLANSPLTDGVRFTAELEKVYLHIWREHLEISTRSN